MSEGPRDNVVPLGGDAKAGLPLEALRTVEALLFASAEPLEETAIAATLGDGVDVRQILQELQAFYAPRGVNLRRIGRKWAFRTAPDLGFLLRKEAQEVKKLSRAAVETLAIIAYHQPVTRGEIEDVRGVTISKGTLDLLMEQGWVRIGRRRQTPGRPVTFVTTDDFLDHFGLESVSDLPGIKELKEAGFLDSRLPPAFKVPTPEDEDPDADEDGDGDLTDAEREAAAALAVDDQREV